MSSSYTGLTTDADGVLRIPPKGKNMEENAFQKFMRYFIPPKEESASPYARQLYQDPNLTEGTPQYMIIEGMKSMFNTDPNKIADDIEKKLEKDKKEKEIDDEDKYLKQNQKLLKDIARLGEEARGRDFMREGIRTLANAPLIGAQAQLAAAEGINRLTIGNMGAMAAQNRVLEANPPKQKIAGRYFRG